MQYYKIRQDGFKEIKKKMLIRTIPLMLIAITFAIAISSINSKAKETDVNVSFIVIPIMLAAVGFGIYNGLKRQKVLFDSYQLTLTDNLISREQLNTPTVSIYFNEITDIFKNKNGGFTIKSKNPTDIIIIPVQIENYVELENTLAKIKPLTSTPYKNFLQQYSIPITILTMALLLSVYTLTNKLAVALTGTCLVIILSWSLIQIQKSKNVDERTKRSSWLVLLVLTSVIAVMIMKLIGIQKT